MKKKKNILITGSSGFIGKKLVSYLTKKGYQVFTFSTKDGDISNPNSLEGFLDKSIDHVFHLAAKTFVPESWINPFEYINVNTLGCINSLEFCRKTGSSMSFISSYMYGNPDFIPINEDAKRKVNNPYAMSKELAEISCEHYYNFFEVNVSVVRPFNVYGIGQSNNFLISKIIECTKENNQLELNDLRPKRDFIYIDDLISGLYNAMYYNGKFEIFNLGYGKSYSIQQVILFIENILGYKINYSSTYQVRPNEIMETVADITKARDILKWEPKIDLESGLRLILNK